MTLDEAIKHAEEVADSYNNTVPDCDCAEEHRQLAEWLKDYKRLREQTESEKCRDCMTVEEYRAKLIDAFHKVDHDELIALVTLPTEKDFEHLEWLLKTHYGNREKCGDCISRQEVLDLFAEKCDAVRPYHEVWQAVKELPPVEPERKPGHWTPRNSFLLKYRCSECGRASEKYDYCPNCGAKMEALNDE